MNEFISIVTRPSVCSFLQALVLIPALAAILLFLIPERYTRAKGIIALIVTVASCYMSVTLYTSSVQMVALDGIIGNKCISIFDVNLLQNASRYFTLTVDNLSKLIVLLTSLFVLLVTLYSIVYIKTGRVRNYYSWFLLTASCSFGAVLSDNLLLFTAFWGILGITLYKLIPGKDEESSATAKKTLILIGASDTVMLLGVALLWRLTGSLSINNISLPTDNILNVTAFLLLLVGSFTKAGAFPFHTWVPDYAKNAPASSSALLPASLDKLLGIYFLARITTGLFELTDLIRLLLLALGVTTIITAVMMALIQHNYKKLLGFHAVSQVGYMIVGFGLGSAAGIAAGLFHMANNALYKGGLFLAAGAVESQTGREEIDDLGGLSKAMPVTFISSLIFAMSISGIPPFNGFASKWMIYQSIIDFGSGAGIANKLWVVWLALAVLGSALTLASFIKLVGGIFLGRKKTDLEKVKEVSPVMWVPMSILALLCVMTGLLSTNLVVPSIFMPVTGSFEITGSWNSFAVSVLVILSILAGIVIYLATTYKRFRKEDSFIGGEKLQDKTDYPTPEYYKTIGELGFFSLMYRKAEEKLFDIYDLSKRFVLWVSHQFSLAHRGVLPGYVLWVFAGLVIMLLILIQTKY